MILVLCVILAFFSPGLCTRTELTDSFLLSGSDVSHLVDNSAFLPIDGDYNTTGRFHGKLTIKDFAAPVNRNFTLIWASSSEADSYPQPFDIEIRHILPLFSFEYVQHKHHLIPVVSRLVPNDDHPYYEYIPVPGRVWREDESSQWNRVALPFAISEKGQNCVYNGLFSFLFKKDGETSKAWYQITSQFCSYYQFNLWGFANVTYDKYAVESDQETVDKFNEYLDTVLPVKSITKLAKDINPSYPQYDLHNNIFNQGPTVNCTIYGEAFWYITTLHECFSPSSVYGGTLNSYGVLYNGVFYQGLTVTRTGPHPYPQWYVYPQYSWDKANYVGGIVGVLDEMYGNNVPKEPYSLETTRVTKLKVAEWVPEASSNGWNDVRVQHILDMATSHYNSPIYGVDEGSVSQNINFFYNYTHNGKLNFSLFEYPRQDVPLGTVFGYQTPEYYVGATLLRNLVEYLDLDVDDLNSLVRKYISRKLKLSSIYSRHRTTYDSRRQEFGGYGGFAYIDDIAKLAKFWTFDDGKAAGERVISKLYYESSMQMDPDNRGVLTYRNYTGAFAMYYPLNSPIPFQRYHNGFWSKDLSSNSTCINKKFVYESGYGGLSMAIFRKSFAYVQLSDNYDFLFDPSVYELSDKIGCSVGLINDQV